MSDERDRTRVDDERTKVDADDFEGHKLGEGRYDDGEDRVGPERVASETDESDDFEGHQLKVTDRVTDRVTDKASDI